MRRIDVLFNLKRAELSEVPEGQMAERLTLVANGATVSTDAIDRCAAAGVATDNILDIAIGSVGLFRNLTPTELATLASTSGTEVTTQMVDDAIVAGLPTHDGGTVDVLSALAWLFANFQAPE